MNSKNLDYRGIQVNTINLRGQRVSFIGNHSKSLEFGGTIVNS